MRAYLLVTLVMILLIIGKCLKEDSYQTETVPVDPDNRLVGIDISHHQGDINWTEVGSYHGSPLSFIYIKATEGSSYQDPRYQEYMDGAKSTGIPVGSYHFFRTLSPVTTQFINFAATADKDDQDLIPMIDVEECKYWSSKQLVDSLDKFIYLVEDYYGKKPILYTANNFYNKHFLNRYMEYPFCIARYHKAGPNLKDSMQWVMWQCTEKARVVGIENQVDIDLLYENYQLSNLKLHQDAGK